MSSKNKWRIQIHIAEKFPVSKVLRKKCFTYSASEYSFHSKMRSDLQGNSKLV